MWNERQQEQAHAEGWTLALVVNEGLPVNTAYLDIFDQGPTFTNRLGAQKFVLAKAQQRSKLHIDAMTAISASRMAAAERHAQAPRKKKA